LTTDLRVYFQYELKMENLYTHDDWKFALGPKEDTIKKVRMQDANKKCSLTFQYKYSGMAVTPEETLVEKVKTEGKRT